MDRPEAPQRRVSPFDFDSYREFLKAWVKWRKSTDASYTYERFMREAGLGPKAKGGLSNLIDGRDNLSPERVEAVLLPLGSGPAPLYPEEEANFRARVAYTQAVERRSRATLEASAAERLDTEVTALARQLAEDRLLWHTEPLGKEKLAYLYRWYCPVIRELARSRRFLPDPVQIATLLRQRVSVREVVEALDILRTLGMLIPDASGVLRPTAGLLVTRDNNVGEPALVYHRAMHGLAGTFMDPATDPLHPQSSFERECLYLGVTQAIRSSELSELKLFLLDVKDRLSVRFERPAPEQVFQINIHLFPLTDALPDPLTPTETDQL